MLKTSVVIADTHFKLFMLLIWCFFFQVNGQNVVGLNDKSVQEIIESGGAVVTVTVIPSMLFKHMIKK